MTPDDFPTFYEAVHGYAPFPWQAGLAHRVAEAGWPAVLAVPTASGKTSAIDVAVFTLAAPGGALLAERSAPLRIFLVIDRRIVVDQAARHAHELRKKLESPLSPLVEEVAQKRPAEFGGRGPLHVSAARGACTATTPGRGHPTSRPCASPPWTRSALAFYSAATAWATTGGRSTRRAGRSRRPLPHRRGPPVPAVLGDAVRRPPLSHARRVPGARPARGRGDVRHAALRRRALLPRPGRSGEPGPAGPPHRPGSLPYWCPTRPASSPRRPRAPGKPWTGRGPGSWALWSTALPRPARYLRTCGARGRRTPSC